jgi:CDP-paratose 2-epimerase
MTQKGNGKLQDTGESVNGYPLTTIPVDFERDQSKLPAVITGGAGFIGANLAHRLASDGRRVIVYDNLSRKGVEKNLQWLVATHGNLIEVEVKDTRDRRSLQNVIKHAGQIFHLAAQVAVTTSLDDPVSDFEVNARGTLNVLESIRARSKPPSLIFTSTNKVYGALEDLHFKPQEYRYVPDTDGQNFKTGIGEERPLDFHSPYGCSKGAADQYVIDYARTYGLPAVVFRMSCIYGPHQFGTEDQGWVAHFLIRAIERQKITIYGDGRQVRDILFVEDLLDAMTLAQQNMGRIAGQAFNIGGGSENTISLLELLELLSQFDGGDHHVEFSEWRHADQRYYVSDISKFRDSTGWVPQVSAREGIHRLYKWLQAAHDRNRLRASGRSVVSSGLPPQSQEIAAAGN